MKLSVSVPDEDVAVLDAYVRSAGLPSRSAAVQQAIRLLRRQDLETDYSEAWDEWDAADRGVWERVTGDGLG